MTGITSRSSPPATGPDEDAPNGANRHRHESRKHFAGQPSGHRTLKCRPIIEREENCGYSEYHYHRPGQHPDEPNDFLDRHRRRTVPCRNHNWRRVSPIPASSTSLACRVPVSRALTGSFLTCSATAITLRSVSFDLVRPTIRMSRAERVSVHRAGVGSIRMLCRAHQFN